VTRALKHSLQKGPELAFLAAQTIKRISFQQTDKETLGQILSILFQVASTPHKRVKRVPIETARSIWRQTLQDFEEYFPSGGWRAFPLV
jgi:hypothetical protein